MKKIAIPVILLAVSAYFYFQTLPFYDSYQAQLREVKESFAANFHAEIPNPLIYESGFYTVYFTSGIAVGMLLMLAARALKRKREA